jgi:5-methylcytosine-specific restriction endonuclease McrA
VRRSQAEGSGTACVVPAYKRPKGPPHRILWNTAANRVCSTCSCRLTWEDFTIDHINPHSKGGRSLLENVALMCRKHNSKKGNKRR